MKAVSVYLKLKEQFVKMLCACFWSVGNHNHFYRDSDIQIFLNGDVLLNGSWFDLIGWEFETELWKDSCCSRRENSRIPILYLIEQYDWRLLSK